MHFIAQSIRFRREDVQANMHNTDFLHMYQACNTLNVVLNETIPGASGKNHKILVAVKNNGMYISVAHNKATGNPVNKKETNRFYDMVDDIKKEIMEQC